MLAADPIRQILIVDRDVAAVEPLRWALCEAGFIARLVTDGPAAIAALSERPPHMAILDWSTPGIDAREVIQAVRRMRSPYAVRLIILSQLSGEENVVTALNLGADDYIAKPFSIREAVARVCSVLRGRPSADSRSPLRCADLVLDGSTNRVTAQGRPLILRGIEYRLLEFLMSHPGRTFNRTQLLTQVWGGSEVDERTVDVNVQRLRKILAQPGRASYIQTVRGFGYRFAAPSGAQAMSTPSRF
jgi:two-component system phosphate regulon response regulator PhoB